MKHRGARVSFSEIAWLAVCAALIAGAFVFGNAIEREPLSSAETRFVEYSASGLQIVPASCPSTPGYAGECSSPTCSIYFQPGTVARGGTSELHFHITGGGTMSHPGGSFPVNEQGRGEVGGDQTKTYTLTSHGTSGGSSGGNGQRISCSATLTVCPAGQTVVNGQCSGNSQCPAGQHGTPPNCLCDNTNQPPVNGQCPNPTGPTPHCSVTVTPAFISPPGGMVRIGWSSQNATNMWSPIFGTVGLNGSYPAAYTGNTTTYFFTASNAQGATHTCQNTVTVCPAGTTVNSAGTGCTGTPQCLNINFCIGNSVYRGDPQQGPPQCPRTHIENCVTRGPGWTCSGGACVPPPSPTVEITASPSLVKSGDTSTITWTSQNTESCTVSENNPDITDAWNTRSGTETSGQLTMQTRYTATCLGLDGTEISDSVIVNVIPSWQEI